MRNLWIAVAALTCGLVTDSLAASPPPSASPAGRAAQSAPNAAGIVSGRVVWHGPRPPMEPMHIAASRPGCGTEARFTALEIGADDGVSGAVVTIDGAAGSPSAGAATITASGCAFEPHVVAVTAGSRLTFSNRDTVLHTIHAFRNAISEFNLAAPPGMTLSHNVRDPAILHVQCECGHTWMGAWIHVVGTPYVAVTDSNGAFRIPNVPPGTYTVHMWHEGWTARPTNTCHADYGPAVTHDATVTIASNGTVSQDFALP